MENISLHFKYSKKQILKAYQFHYSTIFHPKRDITIAIFLLIIGVYFIQINGFNYILASLIVISILFLGLQLLSFYVIPHVIFISHSKYREECHLILKDEGILYKTKEIDSEIKWSFYNRILENDDFILLYYEKNSFTILPKAEFYSDIDLRELKKTLLEKIPRQNNV